MPLVIQSKARQAFLLFFSLSSVRTVKGRLRNWVSQRGKEA